MKRYIIIYNQIIMYSPADDSVEAFLINDCQLSGDCLASTFFKKMGFNSRKQLQAILPHLSVTEPTKLGIPEAEATAIMRHSNKTSPKMTAAKMFPRLANKYITLNIVGYAFVQPEAVHLGYLSCSYKQFLITNYQLFKKELIKAEKKVICSVFELLDERWLSKKYRLAFNGCKKSYFYQDVADCLALLGDRLHFHSIEIYQSHLDLFSKFRPIKMVISGCTDILLLFQLIPHSVADLTLHFDFGNHLSFEGVCIRKFRKLKLLNCEQTLDILSRFVTATESLTINDNCLEEPGVLEYLAQMDCKQIILYRYNLLANKLREFFSFQSKADKFIHCASICFSEIRYIDWACNYFTQKCLNKAIDIKIDKEIEDVEVFFDTLFNGSLKLFKHKSIRWNNGIDFNGNVCIRNGDTHTQSLWTSSCDIAVLALNNCTSLTRLEIFNPGNCQYQQLQVEKLSLQELIIDRTEDSSYPLISDILNKSKHTLSLLSCNAEIDLSPLRNSTQLRTLRLYKNIDDANLEVIKTFNNLQELQTKDKKVLLQFSKSQTLKTLRWAKTLNYINDLPQSVTKVISTSCQNKFDQIKQFLEKNPFVKELEISVQGLAAGQLPDKYKHVKFNFIQIYQSSFTFKQCKTYLHHPECKQICIPRSEPDHILYELLFSRTVYKDWVLDPYLKVADISNWISEAPPEMIKWLSTFNEFKNCLRKDNLDSSYFEKVFNKQIEFNFTSEHLSFIVSGYNEVFQLSADIHKTVTMLKAMTDQQKETLKRERFFHHCKNNWIEPLCDEDFKTI
ncbi:hypothetical protein FGO68_gene4072 [Halteria grandinella]|uniref:Uncharacterized protein n=1 Tax=Halteria grandinella TaxID=5974 RepID=A0A8J8NZ13_HALGN|nr:hypothetical protein FGO68_gene4072 [Halteria grandinella]